MTRKKANELFERLQSEARQNCEKFLRRDREMLGPIIEASVQREQRLLDELEAKLGNAVAEKKECEAEGGFDDGFKLD